MTALTSLPCGGETITLRPCGLCGVPHHHPCRILARHLESMRLRGLVAGVAALPVPGGAR